MLFCPIAVNIFLAVEMSSFLATPTGDVQIFSGTPVKPLAAPGLEEVAVAIEPQTLIRAVISSAGNKH